MHRCVIEDLVLGQPIPTTSASAQSQLCGTVTYSRSRPEAEAHQGPLWGRAEATSASSGLRTAPPPSLSTWV